MTAETASHNDSDRTLLSQPCPALSLKLNPPCHRLSLTFLSSLTYSCFVRSSSYLPVFTKNHPSIIGAFCQNRIINFCIGRVGKILFIFSGDEILSINGQVLQGMTHGQAIAVFKNIKEGKVSLHLARRQQPQLPPFSKRSVANPLLSSF